MPLLAIGAASLALDAFQSLTSPQPASPPPTGFGSALADAGKSSDAPQAPTAASGFSNAQISADNIGALLGSQSQASTNFTKAVDSLNSDSDSSPSTSASNAASSTYNAVNQLTQSTAVPLGISPFSISI